MPRRLFPPINKSRFNVEIHDHSRALLRSIPFNSMQGEWYLNDRGTQLRLNTSLRRLGLLDNVLHAGKHEIWVWDDLVSDFPIFAGPIIQITGQSDGSLNLNCEDYLWYFKRRVLATTEYYTGTAEAAINDLLTYTNGLRDTGVTSHIDSTGVATIAAKFDSGDFQALADLWTQLSAMGDKVDYYVRGDGQSFGRARGAPILHLWGNQKVPTPRTLALRYPGGALEAYTYQQNASAITNHVYVVGTGTGFASYGTATDATLQTDYDALYESSISALQDTNASLNQQGSKQIKKYGSALRLPTLTVKSEHYKPFVDFDLGDIFYVELDDYWAQYKGNVRSVGFQITFGANDQQTTEIYTNTEDEVL